MDVAARIGRGKREAKSGEAKATLRRTAPAFDRLPEFIWRQDFASREAATPLGEQ
jgi:hypothetical protein